ncbi:MAG: hypothetical protein CVU44_19835 [Chloroflexi bacterium HGW-Chloroflexi-6]|nr:MAG: hypothetical protein CVU44_19835 [Chloroflexi bacterium HGW-Chloroflexi-6]
MTFVSNPFLERGPVREPAFLFGRRDELHRLAQAIGANVPQHCSIIGERRIGKTSLLNALAAPDGPLIEFSAYLSRPLENYLFVYADLSALKTRELNSALFVLRLILRNLHRIITQKFQALGLPTNNLDAIFEAYREQKSLQELSEFGIGGYVDEVRRLAPGLVMVFLFDEADWLVRQGIGALLRALTYDRSLSFILSTRLPLVEIDPERELSPLYNMMADTLALGLLAPTEARTMVQALATRHGRTLTDPELDFILETGGCHPDLTRRVAHFTWEAKIRGLSFDPIVIIQSLGLDAASLFEGLWNGMTDAEKALCIDIQSEQTVDDNAGVTLQTLKRKGILNDQDTLFSPLFGEFLASKSVPAPALPPTLRFGDGVVTFGEFVAKLSPIELKLLQYLHEHAGQVCTREEIHAAVWGETYTGNDAVKVNITVQRMKQKLGQLAELVKAVRGLGYRWAIE